MAYLEGGSIKGSDAPEGPRLSEEGAADASAPRDARPFMLSGWQLVFAGRSRRWNQGGVCAVVPAAADTAAFGRAWLVTVGQLGDIWRQENAGVGAEPETFVDVVARRAALDLKHGAYRRLAPVGEIDGLAVMTITGTDEVLARLNKPDPAYQAVVSAGLAETWGLESDEIDRYLAGCLGFADDESRR